MGRPPSGGVPRDRQILAAAAELFHSRGFAGASVDEIGARAGISGPSIYRHFRGKDEILATLFDYGVDTLIAATGGEFDDSDAALRHIMHGYAGFMLRERVIAAVMLQERRSLADPYLRRLRRREEMYIENVAEKIRACYPRSDTEAVRRATWLALGTLNAIALWPSGLTEAVAPDDVADFVLQGLRTLAPDDTREPATRPGAAP